MNRMIKINSDNAAKLKDFRLKHNVKSKDLAIYIDKSPAYISKLEHGEIQRLPKETLIRMANYISGNENGYFEFCQSIIESIDPQKSENDIFLLNFDTIERQVPIPDELVSYLKQEMDKLNISTSQLISYINENEDIKDDYDNFIHVTKNVENNTWYEYIEADSNENNHAFIMLHYNQEKLESLLNHQLTKCEYLFPFALTYHLLKIEKGYRGKTLDDSIISKTQAEAEEILWKRRFYSITIQLRKLQQLKSEEEFKNSLSHFDYKNRELIQKVINSLSYLSSYDVEYTNEKLVSMVNNIEDVGDSFFLAYMALPLHILKDTNPQLKKQFLCDLEKYIKTYDTSEVVPYEKY